MEELQTKPHNHFVSRSTPTSESGYSTVSFIISTNMKFVLSCIVIQMQQFLLDYTFLLFNHWLHLQLISKLLFGFWWRSNSYEEPFQWANSNSTPWSCNSFFTFFCTEKALESLINCVLCQDKILRQLCSEDNRNKGSLALVLLGCLQIWARPKG